MRIGELGEFGLIRRISGLLPPSPRDVVVGIGDDVAVLRGAGDDYLLATCDAQVENVHFIRKLTTPYQLGRKVIAINVSDIAATGGSPLWALVSLALPRDIEVEFVDELYRGMQEELAKAGGSIVGGNLSGAKAEMMIDLSLMGSVAPEHLLLRNGAVVGDLVFITGSPGNSRAGLELLLRPDLWVERALREEATARHLTPYPRLREGRALARSRRVHAMADVSDGVLADLGHICRASGVGAEVLAAQVPVGAACGMIATAAGADALKWVLSGGEDYELLFTAPPECASDLVRILADETGTPCRAIGRIVEGPGDVRVLNEDGRVLASSAGAGGWDHFTGSGNESR